MIPPLFETAQTSEASPAVTSSRVPVPAGAVAVAQFEELEHELEQETMVPPAPTAQMSLPTPSMPDSAWGAGGPAEYWKTDQLSLPEVQFALQTAISPLLPTR